MTSAPPDIQHSAPFRLPHALTERDLLAKYFRTLGTQPYVSNQLACLRWCGLVTTRRDHRTIYYRLADARVELILALAQSLLDDNADHVAACRVIDS